VKVTVDPRGEANLRKLARALIALAQEALAEEKRQDEDPKSPEEAP